MSTINTAPLLEPSQSESPLYKNVQERTLRKLDRRVLSLCCAICFLSYMDRGNISYGAHDLCNDLNLKHKDYGLGVSLFYVGYILSQIISNRAMLILGPAVVLSGITFAWGCVAAALGVIQNRMQFLILRFLLGVAEGGVYPGVYYYLNMFYPEEHLSKASLSVMSMTFISFPLSSPISAGLLKLDGFLDLEGWRWLFLVEGSVPLFFSVFLYLLMANSPEKAKFLDRDEKQWIKYNQKPEDKDLESIGLMESIKTITANLKWWCITMDLLMGFGVVSVMHFWTALIIQEELYGENKDSESCGSAHGGAATAILLTAIPFSLAAGFTFAIRRINPKNRSKFLAVVRTASGFVLGTWIATRKLGFVPGFLSLCLSLLLDGSSSALLIAMAINTFDRSLSSTASSMTNMISSFGGIIVPFLAGIMLDSVGYGWTILALSGILTVSGIVLFLIKDPLLEAERIALLFITNEE